MSERGKGSRELSITEAALEAKRLMKEYKITLGLVELGLKTVKIGDWLLNIIYRKTAIQEALNIAGTSIHRSVAVGITLGYPPARNETWGHVAFIQRTDKGEKIYSQTPTTIVLMERFLTQIQNKN